MTRKLNTPFVIAALVFLLIVLTVGWTAIKPAEAARHWWLELTETERGYYMLGYITASWTWSQGMYEADQIERLPAPARHVYNLLAPSASYTWDELSAAVTGHYTNTDSNTPVWEIIHTYATEFRRNQGDM